ncbi:ankyrin repeat-containing domain protein, partial [Dactylonectria macrodidyma]
LCSAARHGWAEVVLALLELGTEPDFKDTNEDSRTALSHAAQSGSIDTVKELMDWGAFPNSADAKHRTPLSYASEIGRSSVVEILLRDRRVDPDAKDSDGRTPLWRAAEKGHEAVVKLLLDTGKVDLEAKDRYGRTLLSWAAVNGHEAVVKLL